MKTPEQIAEALASEIAAEGAIAFMGREGYTPNEFRAEIALRAIEADRAQLRDKLLDYDEWERLASDDEPAVRMTKIKEALA